MLADDVALPIQRSTGHHSPHGSGEQGHIRAPCARRWAWLRAAGSGCAGMMHYRMGSDSAPDRIDAIRGFLAADPATTEVVGGREMRRYSRTVSLERHHCDVAAHEIICETTRGKYALVHAIRRGVLETQAGRKCDRLEAWFAGPEGPSALFAGRILPFDEKAGVVWARLMAEGTARGRPRNALDMIIAATAQANDCIVVTDNEWDFTDVEFINPLRRSAR